MTKHKPRSGFLLLLCALDFWRVSREYSRACEAVEAADVNQLL